MIALASSAAGLLAIVITLTLMVVGWRGDKHGIDKWLASVPIAADIWNIVRWPILVLILVALLVGLYRCSPNVRHRWRDCLPGAALGVLLWAGAAAIFRAYLRLGSGAPTGVRSNDAQVVLIGRAVGASIGTAVFIYFSSIAILLGAEVNALIIRHRRLAAAAATPLTASVPLPAAGPPLTPRTEGTGRDRHEGRTAAAGRRAGMGHPRPRRCRHRPRHRPHQQHRPRHPRCRPSRARNVRCFPTRRPRHIRRSPINRRRRRRAGPGLAQGSIALLDAHLAIGVVIDHGRTHHVEARPLLP